MTAQHHMVTIETEHADRITRASIMRQAMKDPIECFQIATCHISEGNHAAAIPLLEKAAVVMAGDPDFDALLAMAKAKA